MPTVVDGSPSPVRRPGTPDPNPTTDHVIVVDGSSGAILFQRNPYEPVAPASLTKIMTAILGIEYGNPSDHVKVDVDAHNYEDSTVMGLEPWFDVTLQDILYGLMLPSGNDAAEQIAHYVAGSNEPFVRLMNQKAAWLGLRATHFANPHGLDMPDHYSNPYDMVAMARYGMQYPIFQQLAAAKSYAIRSSNISYAFENLNPLLWSYPGADGVKIGYTDNSGRSIVASATRNGHRVFASFMKSKAGLGPDASLLLDWAFDSFTWPD
jgi:D-alanyl-D-alanine carboxypeptidase (penicillin-binding protein 5/6)